MTIETKPRASDWNAALIEDFRTHGGQVTQGYFAGRELLLLTTKGARTGETRTSPLAYTRDGDRIVIIASKGGAPTHPAWYHNLIANPRVSVELGGERFEALATVEPEPERRRLYDQHSEVYPGFREYEAKTTRVIPVITLRRA
jgi:deazaflavin-dependent oxidoreductase (nitroreductase family)